MKQKTGRKLLSFLLTLAMVVGLMPGMSLTAYAENPNNLSTAVSPEGSGSIQHNGCTYTAVSVDGYTFDHWMITGYFYPESNPLIKYENPYTFASNNYNYYTITAVFTKFEGQSLFLCDTSTADPAV